MQIPTTLRPRGRAEWTAWLFEASQACAWAIATVLSIAAVLDVSLRRAFEPSIFQQAGIAWALVVVLHLAGRPWRSRRHVRPPAWLGWVLALGVFAGATFLPGLLDVGGPDAWDEPSGLWVMRAGSTMHEHGGTRPQVDYQFNDWGLRGAPGRRPARGDRVVVVIGDSRPFSAGVPEGDTLPERLEESLRTRHDLPAAVFNFSMAGCGPDTYSRLVSYSRRLLDVDTVVVYLVDHHVDVDNDMQVRRRRVEQSFLYRLLLVVRLEDLAELIRQRFFPAIRDLPRMRQRFVESLDRIAAAADGAPRLLIVPELHDDFAEWYREWAGRHPRVITFDVAGNREWEQAPTFRETGDEHWTIEGQKVVARILADRIAALWSPPSAPE